MSEKILKNQIMKSKDGKYTITTICEIPLKNVRGEPIQSQSWECEYNGIRIEMRIARSIDEPYDQIAVLKGKGNVVGGNQFATVFPDVIYFY